jgi:hypothetical protein
VHDHGALKFCKAISSTMKIALTKNYNVKREKNANFRTPLSERNNSWKSPRVIPPSPPLLPQL